MDVEYKAYDDKRSEIIADGVSQRPIQFVITKAKDAEGKERIQSLDAAKHMRYAATLNLPVLKALDYKEGAKAIIVGGAPSIKAELPNIKALASDPKNGVFAINWSHTWLINNGIVPDACLMFEVDAEPIQLLQTLHPDVTYYVCSHCHELTFDSLKNYKAVLWHAQPGSDAEKEVRQELFNDTMCLGGGVGTFLRSMSLALALGYRDFDLFGVDSSFPADSPTTHVEGYPAMVTVEEDRMDVYARNDQTGEIRCFPTVGYLAHQVEEFKTYCATNHVLFNCRVHGDGLLPWVHRSMYPGQYDVQPDSVPPEFFI